MRLEHCKARSAEIGCVSFEGFFVSTRNIKEVIPSKECINLTSMKVFSSSLNKFKDSSGVRNKYFSFAMYSECTVCLARRRTGSCLKISQACFNILKNGVDSTARLPLCVCCVDKSPSSFAFTSMS